MMGPSIYQDEPRRSVPMVIGSHTVVERDCRIRAAAIGSYCWIGKRVVLGERVIVKDCCVIRDDVVLGDDTVIPPFTLVQSTVPRGLRRQRPKPSGMTGAGAAFCDDAELTDSALRPLWSSYAPSYVCTELPPSTVSEMQERSIEQYAAFAASQSKRS
jgi:carbonic anhydrase/acetyltransferase-like protein (isoleucine patch superfamily)